MTLSEFKQYLTKVSEIQFQLPGGTMVPFHFHVTEVGQVTKKFIDCGGTVRNEKTVSFQLWEAGDFDHRLAPQKLASIIELSEKVLGLEDGEIEVEYQDGTIGKYGLDFNGRHFLLKTLHTACLASDACGTGAAKPKIRLSELQKQGTSCCTPGSGCC